MSLTPIPSEISESFLDGQHSLERVLMPWDEVVRRLMAGTSPDDVWADYDRIILKHRETCKRFFEAIGRARS